MLDFLPIDYATPASASYEHVAGPRDYNDLNWHISLKDIASEHLNTMSKTELDQDWKLNDFFETIFIINLPNATERLEKISTELSSINTQSFAVYSAIDGRKNLDSSIWKKIRTNLHKLYRINTKTRKGRLAVKRLHQGQAGCYMSHYKLIQQAKDAFDDAKKEFELAKASCDTDAIQRAIKNVRKYSRVLILEDDSGFGFLKAKQSVVLKDEAGQLLRKALETLPDDWDMLYLVVNPSGPTSEVSPYLRKLNGSWSLNAYAVNHSMYGPLVEHLKKIEDPNVSRVWAVDVEISEIHHLYKVYAIYPSIVFSQKGKSYISNKSQGYWQGQPVSKK